MPEQKFIDNFRNELNELGEESVRTKIASREWSAESAPTKLSLAEEWLKSKDDARSAAAEARRAAREDETLSIAREANRIAERALSKATMANIWAAIAALIAAIAIYAAIFIDKP